MSRAVSRWRFAPVVALTAVLVGCGADCRAPDCRLSLTTGPGDGAYVPGALEATATSFLGPSSAGSGSGGGAGGGPAGSPRLRIDRDTLAPGSGTAFRVPRNQSLGLRAEVSRPLAPGLRGYAALGGAVGRHDYLLPQGLGPLTDPMKFSFRTVSLTPEVGVVHERALSDAQLRLSTGVGVSLTRTRTHLTSALLDVSSRYDAAMPYVSLGAGLVLAPQGPGLTAVEVATQARLAKGGKGVLRSEIRLSR